MIALRSRMWLLSAIVIILGAALSAQVPCILNSGMGGIGTLNPQTGIRTVKVMVASDLTDGTKDAIDAAIAAWNAQTSTTKVNFEKVGSGGHIGISRSTAQVHYNGAICGWAYAGGNVYLESDVDNLGNNPNATTGSHTNAAILTYLATHELGHVLNLQQTQNAGSIMDGLSGGSDCIDALTNYMPSTLTIQSGDASSAADCANRSDPVPEEGGGNGASEENPPECWDVYWVTIWYEMDESGNWSVFDVDWDYLYTTCGDNPYPT